MPTPDGVTKWQGGSESSVFSKNEKKFWYEGLKFGLYSNSQ